MNSGQMTVTVVKRFCDSLNCGRGRIIRNKMADKFCGNEMCRTWMTAEIFQNCKYLINTSFTVTFSKYGLGTRLMKVFTKHKFSGLASFQEALVVSNRPASKYLCKIRYIMLCITSI